MAEGFGGISFGGVLLGLGTAMVYPTLLAAIGDVALSSERASAIGVYRFWRDMGHAIGAVLAGVMADLFGIDWAMWMIALLAFLPGMIVAIRMKETFTR